MLFEIKVVGLKKIPETGLTLTVSKGCPDNTTQIPPHPPAMMFLLPDKIPLAVDFSELILGLFT